MGRTAPLTSKRCILYIYSTNTEYFKHDLYFSSFSLQNAVCFIMLTCLVSVLFTFYIQDVLKFKKNSVAKGLMKILPMGSELFRADGQTDGQADMTKPIVAFCNFAMRLKHFVDLTEFSSFGVWHYLFGVCYYVSYKGNVSSPDCRPTELNCSVNVRGRPSSG